MTRKPRAYRLDDPDVVTVGPQDGANARGPVVVTEEPLETIEAADGVPVPLGPKRGPPWGAVLWSALGALFVLGLGLAVEGLIRGLYETADPVSYTHLTLPTNREV